MTDVKGIGALRIVEILRGWNAWDRDLPTGTRRERTSHIFRFLASGKLISIFGVRRSGKSYIMRQLAKEAIDRAGEGEGTLMINFEEPEFDDCTLEDLQRIYRAYRDVVAPKERPFIFLDEIQNVPRWERFARAMQEKGEAHVIVSGSSSKLLSEELSTVLAGRQLKFEVFPLGFKEFLRFRGLEIKDEKDVAFNAEKIRSGFYEYLRFGGLPEIVLSSDEDFKLRAVKGYYDDILIKDVVARFGVQKLDKMRSLAKYYLTNACSPITFNRASRFTGESVETIRRYTEHLCSSRCIFFLTRHSFSVKEQENSPRIVYSIDPYLSSAVGFRFSENRGKILENVIAIELLRRQSMDETMEVYYWKDRTGQEVDLVIKRGLKVGEL
ncbi:MAG: ATP-binding protein, partial [Candidatus Thermoplasmatota archaeon]